MVTIYSEIKSPRLSYVCDFIFNSILHLSYKLVDDVTQYDRASQPKIKYSKAHRSDEENVQSDLQIIPNGLLSETGIKEQSVKIGEWNGFPTLFAHASNSKIPFDLFSAVFYLMTRYEEYLPSERDNHDRYLAKNSILHKTGALHRPLIDLWVSQLNTLLTGEEELNRSYSFTSTIDIDNAFAYKFKPFYVKVGGTIRSLLKGDKADVKRRLDCYFNSRIDPYDTYKYINEVHTDAKVPAIYFMLLSNRNEWDKNLPFSNQHFRNLIKALQRSNEIGIHPGYNSYLAKEITREEIFRLEDILGSKVTHSRQHFLKFNFPQTAKNLVELGIKHDYSLGYAETIGFRAGTCTPFKFFNLEEERVYDLTLHPSAVMDATLNRYLELAPDGAIAKAGELIKEVKQVKGELITIWHNETLSDIREWKGWRTVFEHIISLAKS